MSKTRWTWLAPIEDVVRKEGEGVGIEIVTTRAKVVQAMTGTVAARLLAKKTTAISMAATDMILSGVSRSDDEEAEQNVHLKLYSRVGDVERNTALIRNGSRLAFVHWVACFLISLIFRHQE